MTQHHPSSITLSIGYWATSYKAIVVVPVGSGVTLSPLSWISLESIFVERSPRKCAFVCSNVCVFVSSYFHKCLVRGSILIYILHLLVYMYNRCQGGA